MCPEFSLLILQTRFLLPSHSSARHDHHYRFVPCLLSVGRAAWSILPLFSLDGPEFFPPFTTLFDRRYPFRIIGFRFLAWSENIIFGYEHVPGLSRLKCSFFISLQSCKLSLCFGPASLFNSLGGCLKPQVI